MHFEILVEGQTELTALSILMPKILGDYGVINTWRIHKHQGVGELPEDIFSRPNPNNKTLLHQLPAKIRAYAKANAENQVVLVLLDADDRNEEDFLSSLRRLNSTPEGRFNALFLIAKEELEAWYLGDVEALLSYNENIDLEVVGAYRQDSVCGTWEVLAKADDPTVLKHGKRSASSLDIKKRWSKKVPPHMELERNGSPSFNDFVRTFELLAM